MTRIHNNFSDDGPEVCAVFFIQYWKHSIRNVPAPLQNVVWHINKVVILDLLYCKHARLRKKLRG